MKIPALAVLALAVVGVTVLGQDNPDPPRRRPPHTGASPGYGWGNGSSGYLQGTGYGGGYGSGYGYGYGTGGVWGGGISPGSNLGYLGFGSLWGGYGGYYGGYGGGGYSYPGTWPGEGYFGRPHAATATAGPTPPLQPAIDRTPQAMSLRDIEEGRRRFRMADYRGAVDSFRSAVAATTDSPVAQAWFAVSLVALGEGRNADKALRSAVLSGLPPASVSLDGLFRDEKEKVRLIVALAKVGTDGSLAAAYALSLAGEPVRLKQLAEKDPAARLLLPKP
ncbi:MAG TPA: hypothetical protein VMU54_03270 [Planctomycetota bacterium]|nr:hypothetical protein [Planctomycetota bacterium]